MKKNITFHDKENNLIHVEIELKDGRFSMSGDCGRSCGQCQDSIIPTPNQEKLLQLWEKYHLNDMNAGTIEQENMLKECKSHDYKDQIAFLKEKGLYMVTLEDGKKYEYGSGWIARNLPDDIWDQVLAVCGTIDADEILRKQSYEKKEISWGDIDDEKIQALGKFLHMEPAEAQENITDEDSGEYTSEGIRYFVGSEEDTEQKCKDYLTDDTELYRSWVEQQIKEGNASNIMNIDDWADFVLESDDYGQILNSWDGTTDFSDEYKLYIIRI